jgi:ribosomal protein S27AE
MTRPKQPVSDDDAAPGPSAPPAPRAVYRVDESLARAAESHRICPGCGAALIDRGCKMRCPRCGFFLDCSDG